MANVPLKSIKFPGLQDTYKVLELDSDLETEGKAADAKAVGDIVNSLGDIVNSLGLSVVDGVIYVTFTV